MVGCMFHPMARQRGGLPSGPRWRGRSADYVRGRGARFPVSRSAQGSLLSQRPVACSPTPTPGSLMDIGSRCQMSRRSLRAQLLPRTATGTASSPVPERWFIGPQIWVKPGAIHLTSVREIPAGDCRSCHLPRHPLTPSLSFTPTRLPRTAAVTPPSSILPRDRRSIFTLRTFPWSGAQACSIFSPLNGPATNPTSIALVSLTTSMPPTALFSTSMSRADHQAGNRSLEQAEICTPTPGRWPSRAHMIPVDMCALRSWRMTAGYSSIARGSSLILCPRPGGASPRPRSPGASPSPRPASARPGHRQRQLDATHPADGWPECPACIPWRAGGSQASPKALHARQRRLPNPLSGERRQ